MSSSVLEQIRLNHEQSDSLERLICDELDQKPQGQKAKTWQQLKIAKVLDKLVSCNIELGKQYEDTDGLLKDEVEAFRGPNMFNNFYQALNETREYHQRFPNISAEVDFPFSIVVDVNFAGEEVYGKYLDLNSFFLNYINIPNVPGKDQDYLQYLDKFNSFFHIPESAKSTKAYTSYLIDLWFYLSGFLNRIQPLVDLDYFEHEWKRSFEEKWIAGTVSGWKSKGGSGLVNKSDPQPLRLGMFNSAAELEALGMDRLKEGLMALGLKCGGSLSDRANRLWSVRGKKPEDFPAKLLVKSSTGGSNVSKDGKTEAVAATPAASVFSDFRMLTAWTEFKIWNICELLMDIVIATRRHAEKQQTRTVEEKEAEIAEEELGLLPDVDDADERQGDARMDDEAPLYNPLNLPLGWDGKPIPYWLYKLHGLGVEYKCEICGNQSYWGRRAFDRHFQEWRHAHGMRCLGVPNTKHFHDITLIEDVLTLYAKIKTSLTSEQFVGDVHEEFEDTEGNVLNRRTYEDLARQGLL